MKCRIRLAVSLAASAVLSATMGLPAVPSVYPTGTTIYDPARTWSGYTIFDTPEGPAAVLLDMNGNVVKQWRNMALVPVPFRIQPGGYLVGGSAARPPTRRRSPSCSSIGTAARSGGSTGPSRCRWRTV